jgi:protein TonB
MIGRHWLLIVAGNVVLPLSAAGAAVDKSSPVTPLENPGTWLHANEIPVSARKESGSVAVRLDVDPSGRVSGCTIVESTAPAILNDAACAMFTRHGRFKPAQDETGKAIGSTYTIPGIRFTPD